MRKLIGTIILAFTCITTSNAADLVQVVQQALTFDQQFQSAKATYLAATEAYPQAAALLYPTINFTGSISTAHNKTLQGFQGNAIESGNVRGFEYTLTASQPVINFTNWFGVCVASEQVKAAAATFAAAAQDLLLRTAQAYFNVLQAEDTVLFTEAELLANKQQLDQATQRFQVGLDAITSVYNAQASYDQTVAQLIAAKNNVLNTKEELREITGVYYKHLDNLKKTMPLLSPQPKDVEVWIRKSELFNFQLQSARFTAEAARQSIKVAFAGHLPTVNLVGTSQRIRIGNPEEGIGGSQDTRDNTVALQLSMPIFQGGLITSQVRQQQYNYQNAFAQMENIHQQVMVNLRQTYNSIMSGISKIKADEQAVVSQQASVDSINAAVIVGTRTIFELLQAQQQLFEAQTTLAQDQYAYINNTLLFKALAGTLTYHDMRAINTWLKGKSTIKSPYNNIVAKEHLLVTRRTMMPVPNHFFTAKRSWITALPESYFRKSLPYCTRKTSNPTVIRQSIVPEIDKITFKEAIPEHHQAYSKKKITTKKTASSENTVSDHTKIKIKKATAKTDTQKVHHAEKTHPAEKTFSIQLAARQNKAAINQFMKQHHLNNDNLIIHKTQVNGQVWYVLVYGHYNSELAAHAAIKTLPNKLKKLDPWVRPTP